MPKFQIQKDPITGDISFSGTISEYDMMNVKLDRVELAMILYPPLKASDILLDLEMLYRRMEQQADGEPK